MMKKLIVVFGNFDINNRLGGQTVRTNTVYESIKKHYLEYNIIKLDTACNNKIILLIKTLFFFCICKRIIILPAQKSLFPILKIIHSLKLEKKVIYVVIGGWLFDYIKDNQNYINILKKLKAILVQVDKLKQNLINLNLKNVDILLNYRSVHFDMIEYKEKVNKIVFYSRIFKEKGIEIAVEAVKNINLDIELDIYGPINADYESSFFEIINNEKRIHYCGVLNGFETIISTLSQYRFMIFPTYYEGEGFPRSSS